MRSDIYVGSLSRYYARDWGTVIQRQGRERGTPVVIQRANKSKDAITGRATIRQLALTWRSAMNTRTYQGGPGELAQWRLEMPVGRDQPFEPRAKTGMASAGRSNNGR